MYLYVIEPASKMLIFPYCSITSLTDKTVKITQHLEKTETLPIPKRYAVFSIYNAPTNWLLLEELQVHNPLTHNYNISIHKNTLRIIQQHAEFREVDWDYVSTHVSVEQFVNSFDGAEEKDETNVSNEVSLHNCYSLLGITEDSETSVIKEVWLKLAHIYHPDKKTGNSDHFRMLSDAYKSIMKYRG